MNPPPAAMPPNATQHQSEMPAHYIAPSSPLDRTTASHSIPCSKIAPDSYWLLFSPPYLNQLACRVRIRKQSLDHGTNSHYYRSGPNRASHPDRRVSQRSKTQFPVPHGLTSHLDQDLIRALSCTISSNQRLRDSHRLDRIQRPPNTVKAGGVVPYRAEGDGSPIRAGPRRELGKA